MGYSTNYSGSVKIIPTPTPEILVKVKKAILVAHEESEWALKIGDDFSSIQWRGNEKTYDFEKTLNAVERYMKDAGIDFSLEGEFEFQGEESSDRGFIRKVEGEFVRVDKALEADEYICPDCGHIFKPSK